MHIYIQLTDCPPYILLQAPPLSTGFLQANLTPYETTRWADLDAQGKHGAPALTRALIE
jgi:hypothetical protein